MISEYEKQFGNKWLWACGIALTSIVLFAVTKGAVQQDKKKSMDQIEGLLSQDSRTRDQAVDSISQDRSAIINELIPLIDPANSEKYNDGTRCIAAFLLGKFRAVEAVSVLSQALANEPEQIAISDISRYDAPVWIALVRIGRPAVPAMIENIETSDDRILRIKSLDVLNHVLGGKRRVLELLTKLKVQAKDRSKVQRVQSAIQHTQAHFKEDEEPLY
ncbi:MAG: hypothetical protein IIB56_19555 [Planctomycetes bacterium]|nr:hypothetical protein [Planctomycetota bacterium]